MTIRLTPLDLFFLSIVQWWIQSACSMCHCPPVSPSCSLKQFPLCHCPAQGHCIALSVCPSCPDVPIAFSLTLLLLYYIGSGYKTGRVSSTSFLLRLLSITIITIIRIILPIPSSQSNQTTLQSHYLHSKSNQTQPQHRPQHQHQHQHDLPIPIPNHHHLLLLHDRNPLTPLTIPLIQPLLLILRRRPTSHPLPSED